VTFNAGLAITQRRNLRVGGAVRQHTPDEAIAERLGVGSEAFGSTEPVALKAVRQNRQVLSLEALTDGVNLVRADVETRGVLQPPKLVAKARARASPARASS